MPMLNVEYYKRVCEYDYEVRHISLNGEKYVVNLSKKECSCRMWMLTGLPCFHAMSCMKNQHLQIDDFSPDCYKKDLYEACYSPIIYRINGEALWTKSDIVDLQSPPIKRQPGRPKKKRNREAGEMVRDETHLKRENHGIKCSCCHKEGHNKATNKQPQPVVPPTQVAEGASTQEPQTIISSQPPQPTV
ncbi:unnamed protein product [Lathyrus oleraceus]